MINEIKSLTHDLVNKYAILQIRLDTARIQDRPIPPSTLAPIVERIGEILKDICQCIQAPERPQLFIETMNLFEFSNLLKMYAEKLSFIYHNCRIYLQNEMNERNKEINIDRKRFYQVLENIVENSANSLSTIVSFNLILTSENLTLSIEDNGKGGQETKSPRILPHGTGTRIIYENLQQMGAQVTSSKTKNNSFIVVINFPVINLKK